MPNIKAVKSSFARLCVVADIPLQFALAGRAEIERRAIGVGERVGAVHRATIENAVRNAEHVTGFVS